MKYIDYLFFRIFGFYSKREKDIPFFASCLVLTVVINVTIMDVFFLIEDITRYKFLAISKIEYFIVMLLILTLVFFRYNKKRLEKIELRYMNELTGLKKKKGLTIVGYILIIILYPLLSAYIKHNL